MSYYNVYSQLQFLHNRIMCYLTADKLKSENMESDLYQKIIENYINAYNNFDIDRMLSDMHDKVRFENSSNGEINLATNGIEELRNQAEQAKQLFNERTQTITDIKFSADQVEVQIDYRGILAVDFPSGPKIGDVIELKGSSIFRFKDNKIIELKDIS
jgi:hypothetical protein